MSDERNRVERAIQAVEIPESGWPEDRAGVWLMALDEAVKAADAALAEIGGVRVKPLEWTQIGDGKGRDIYSTIHWANSPYGSYYIGLQPRGENPFDWSGPNNSGGRDFGCAEAAKTAAQTRHQKQVAECLAAIEPGPVHPDDIAVDRFAAAMKEKLRYSREVKNRGGWERKDEVPTSYLSRLLREHVDKGDPLDVGNLAMMLHQRGDRIEPARAIAEGKDDE